jgi:hypothetical protein
MALEAVAVAVAEHLAWRAAQAAMAAVAAAALVMPVHPRSAVRAAQSLFGRRQATAPQRGPAAAVAVVVVAMLAQQVVAVGAMARAADHLVIRMTIPTLPLMALGRRASL